MEFHWILWILTKNRFEIQLRPENLGKIQISLEIIGENVDININSDNITTIQSLLENNNNLQKMLQSQGLNLNSFNLNSNNNKNKQKENNNSSKADENKEVSKNNDTKTSKENTTDSITQNAIEIDAFPNPLNDRNLTIELSKNTENAEISLYDINGKRIFNSFTNETVYKINNRIFPSKGIYVLTVKEASAPMYIIKIAK